MTPLAIPGASYSRLMSVKVDLDKLAETLVDFPFGYLITVGDDFRAHTVAVTPVFEDGAFVIGPLGGTTRRNAGTVFLIIWHAGLPLGCCLRGRRAAKKTHAKCSHRQHYPHCTPPKFANKDLSLC